MHISKPDFEDRIFAATNILMPENGKVILVRDTIIYYPIDAYTVQGGTRFKTNPWTNPYRYKLVGPNALGLVINSKNGKISGTVNPISTKTKIVPVKIAIFDSINKKCNFSDPLNNFTRIKFCTIYFDVRWPPINAAITKTLLIININDTIDFNPFVDNGVSVVSGGTGKSFKYEFDVDYLKSLYPHISFSPDITKKTFGGLSLNNNTGKITGTISSEFLEFFNNNKFGTEIISLYFIIKDRLNNISGVDNDGEIYSRIKIDLSLTVDELYILTPPNPINLILSKTVDNTSQSFTVISKIVGGLKPHTVSFESKTFDKHFQLIIQSDDSVIIKPKTVNLPEIPRINNQSSATINVIDSMGQFANITAFIEVH